MFKWFKRDENLEDYDEDDSYTKRDFKITLLIVLGIFCLWGFW